MMTMILGVPHSITSKTTHFSIYITFLPNSTILKNRTQTLFNMIFVVPMDDAAFILF